MPIIATIFFNILAPVFLLVGIGYVVGPKLELDVRTVSRLGYYILAPAFLFNIFSQAQIEADLALRMSIYIIIVVISGAIVAYGVAQLLRCSREMTSVFILVSVFGNVGNFGFPIIEFKYGEMSLVPAALYFIVMTIMGFLVGVTAATWHKGGRLQAVGQAFKTPAILAVFPAVAVNLLDYPVPLLLERAFSLLADAMIPIMLLTLGLQLAGMGRPKLTRDIMLVGGFRLLIGPVLAILLAPLFGLVGVERGAGILQASMPAAVLVVLIAMEHDLVPDVVTTAVLLSTVASAVTLTAVLAII